MLIKLLNMDLAQLWNAHKLVRKKRPNDKHLSHI